MTSMMGVCLLHGLLQAGPGTIRLKASAVVTTPTITLGEVADIQVTDPALHSRLLALALAESDTTVLSIPLIEQALEQAGIPAARLDIFGASRCHLTRPPQPVAANPKATVSPGLRSAEKTPAVAAGEDLAFAEGQGPTLVEALNREVARLSRMDPDRLHIQWQCRSTPELLQRGFSEGRFQLTPRSAMSLGNVAFDVVDTTDPAFRDKDGKTHARRYPLRGKVQYRCDSIVAARQLRPGEVIAAEDLKWLSRRVDNMRDVGLTDLHQAVGLETARLVPEGTLITPRMLRKVILIERHDDVSVSYNDGRIAVRFRGKAKQAGGLGDTITVEDLANKSLIQGRVAGPGQVVVGDQAQKWPATPSANSTQRESDKRMGKRARPAGDALPQRRNVSSATREAPQSRMWPPNVRSRIAARAVREPVGLAA